LKENFLKKNSCEISKRKKKAEIYRNFSDQVEKKIKKNFILLFSV